MSTDMSDEDRAEIDHARRGITVGRVAVATLTETLSGVNPQDSDAALVMWQWLTKYQRITKIATLEGNNIVLFAYQEPAGSTKAGYSPGVSIADQIVDKMVKAVADKTPIKHGICIRCFSAIEQGEGDAVPHLSDVEGDQSYRCRREDLHIFA